MSKPLSIAWLTDLGKENPRSGVDVVEELCETIAVTRFRYVPIRVAERAVASKNARKYLESRGYTWLLMECEKDQNTLAEIDASEIVRESTFSSPTPGNVAVRCPVCGGEYVQIVSMREVSGHDDYRAGWWGRGNLNVLSFDGECGHKFELCFGAHKGTVSVFGRINATE